MNNESFRKEFINLCKKHFFKKNVVHEAFPTRACIKVGTAKNPRLKIEEPNTQTQLESLCIKLFEKKELMRSGKLQFIGLETVRNNFGERWPEIKELIYKTTELIISKYLDEKDLFIKHQDDTYIIFFAEASYEESHIKATLISEEIKHLLLKTEKEKWKFFSIEKEIKEIDPSELKDKNSIADTIDSYFPSSISHPDDVTKQNKKIKNKNPEAKTKTNNSSDYVFMPIWDVKRNGLTTYICLKNTQSSFNALDGHKGLYFAQPHSKIREIDFATLRRAQKELAKTYQAGLNVFITCPVHYSTLSRQSCRDQYCLILQKIPDELKKFLFFLVIGTPKNVHQMQLQAFAPALKSYCLYLCADVPLTGATNFETYRISGVDSVGVDLTNQEYTKEDLNKFVMSAKKRFIPFTFALGVSNVETMTDAITAKFDFIGGIAIHESVRHPAKGYRFKYSDLFSPIGL